MFKTFFILELRRALKQPMVYILFALVTLLVFGATSSDNIQIGGSVGNVLKNSPHVITVFSGVLSIFGLLMAAAFFNNAALRDYNYNFNEILFSTPLNKAGYFFGRFFGALLLATIPMLGVFAGVWLGTLIAPAVGWEDPSRFGPFYLETFVNNYFLFILPNMFFAGAIIFALANQWKSTVISFVGALGIIVAYIISGTLVSDVENETLAALTDSFGIRTYSIHAKYYTPIEKNTLSPGFTGLIMMNRLIWSMVGLGVLLLSYFTFSFKEKNKKAKKSDTTGTKTVRNFKLPTLHPVFNWTTEWLQFISFFKTNFISIVKSVVFRILFIFAAIILISNLSGGFESFGLKSYPLTYKVIDVIDQASGIFVVIILVFFSGELIWRDRDSSINEVVDATPHASFTSMAAKALSLVGVTASLHVFFVFCGVAYQLLNGFTRVELDVYFLNFIYSNLPGYIVFSGLMLFIQVLLNNKYIGYFVSILVIFLWGFLLSALDIQSNMLSINGGPSLRYSDMNGFGPGLTGAIWFNVYWILISVLLLLFAGSIWNRGVAETLKNRFAKAAKHVPRGYRMVMLGVFSCWLLVAGVVFYNTQILNDYRTSDQREEERVAYEKEYKKYEGIAQPKITDAKYDIQIFPYKRDVLIAADLALTNNSDDPIDSIHFNTNEEWDLTIEIPGAELALHDKDLGYRIYRLKSPMKPGQTLRAKFNTAYVSEGFENGTGNTNVVKNGTFLNNRQILPSIGYSSGTELGDKNTRRKYGLPIKDRMPKLTSHCTDACMANYLTDGTSDYINVETVISTASDQIAIAPGSLIKEWKEGDRNYYHYKVDHPSQNFYSFISAKYEVAKRTWKGIDIEVYYDQKHGVNVEMMLDAVERSLAYYTENFGPYYHKQCRIIEFPRYASFAQAFPGTMPYSEAIGFVTNLEDENDNNIIDAVVAHEMAHQWWAHQVVGANMQGGTMMSESFAEYSSLMTMKHIAKTPMKMREFLKYDHNRYLRGRSGEIDKELPLYKVENQTHIHYGKGSVILYALQDYIGEEKVNTAMKNFLDEFKYKAPPYPTSLDFLKHLEPEVPDSMKYLIDDWFKEITLYDNRLKEATFKELPNGKYQVSIALEAYKMKADTIGTETKVPIKDWIDIGAFADEDEEDLIYSKRVMIDKEKMEFTFETDKKPVRAAIDPRRLLIDRVYDDNSKSVSLEE